jgi:septal ring factor EnvC (AmiA/AmiB activator)
MDKTLSNVARVSLVVVASTLCLAARAGDHAAADKIAVAKAAIEHAEQAGGPEAAPVQMASARDKLAVAEKDIAKHDDKLAAAWADQANIDAQVAEATATQARSSKAAVEFDASLQTLRQEASRPSQPAQ